MSPWASGKSLIQYSSMSTSGSHTPDTNACKVPTYRCHNLHFPQSFACSSRAEADILGGLTCWILSWATLENSCLKRNISFKITQSSPSKIPILDRWRLFGLDVVATVTTKIFFLKEWLKYRIQEVCIQIWCISLD